MKHTVFKKKGVSRPVRRKGCYSFFAVDIPCGVFFISQMQLHLDWKEGAVVQLHFAEPQTACGVFGRALLLAGKQTPTHQKTKYSFKRFHVANLLKCDRGHLGYGLKSLIFVTYRYSFQFEEGQ
jgi:hypothetical protein